MKIHTQSALVILGTLIIGIVLGSVLTTVFVDQRLQRIPDMTGPGNFGRFVVEEIIRPVDDAQREKLERITNRCSENSMATLQCFRVEMKEIMDSLLIEVKPVLTEEQYNRLKYHIENARSLRHGSDRHFRSGRRFEGKNP